jgi:daunorubicin resistance ABC transporter ATP-binding subunit
MSDYAISVEGLSHCFGKTKVVDDIYFKVKEGEIFSFLGPNGAGKTTTISILITLLSLQKGKVTVGGFDVAKQKEDVRKSIGVVFQENRLDRDLTIQELMDFHGRIHSLSKETRRVRIEELLSIIELTDKRNEYIKNLSGGMKRRVEIARGLMTRPKVLFLDEPTIGLDIQTRRKIWSYIKRINKEEGVTVFLTTHYMDEADQYCDKICIIDRGKIIADGSSHSLKNAIGKDRVYLQTDNDSKAQLLLVQLPEITRIGHAKDGLILNLTNGDSLTSKLLDVLQKGGLKISGFNILKPTLDDVFIHYTGRGISDGLSGAEESAL